MDAPPKILPKKEKAGGELEVDAGEDGRGSGSSRSRSLLPSLAVAPRSAMGPRRRPWMRQRE
jgi:hypothetical protein